MSTWADGDYPAMAERLAPASAAAVERAGVLPEDRVVDVATGTGNAALAAAEHGSEVVGVDFEPALVAIARERSPRAGRPVRWEVADATSMPVDDGWATVVLSIFGVMYAPDQEAAAAEVARVAAPGARVVLASWVPGSFMPAFGQAVGGFLPPPPPASGAPSRWGDPEALGTLLHASGITLHAHAVRTVPLSFADVADATSFLVRTAGHLVAQQAYLEHDGVWPEVVSSVTELVEQRHVRNGDRIELQLEYLLAESRRSS